MSLSPSFKEPSGSLLLGRSTNGKKQCAVQYCTYFACSLLFGRMLLKTRGFRKALGVDLPPKVVAYYNPHFQKSSPNLVTQIINHSSPANRKRKAAREEEPRKSEASKARSSTSRWPHGSLDSASARQTATSVSNATTSDATAALELRAQMGSNLLSSAIPSIALPRSDDSLRHSVFQRIMTPSNIGLWGHLGERPLGLPLGQPPQNQAALRSEFLLQQHNLSTAATSPMEQRLLLLQSQRQQSQFQQLHRQLVPQGPSFPNFDALARLAQLQQQQQSLDRTTYYLLLGRQPSREAEGTEEHDERKKED
jgi:hypothetical protein